MKFRENNSKLFFNAKQKKKTVSFPEKIVRKELKKSFIELLKSLS